LRMPLDLDEAAVDLSALRGGPSSRDFPLDLDAVTVHQPRSSFLVAGRNCCEWAQETETVSIFVAAGTVRARELYVKIQPTRLEVALKIGGGRLLSGALGGRCDPSESEWEIADGNLHITLRKALQREWVVPLQPDASPAAAACAAGAPVPSAPVSIAPPATVPAQSSRMLEIADNPIEREPVAAPVPSRALDELESLGSGRRSSMDVCSVSSSSSSRSKGGSSRSGSGGSSLGAAYRAWDRFDELGALAGVENEGKSAEEPGFTLRADKGVAAMQCTEYVKDREEIALDEELSDKRASLQTTFNQRLARAADLKTTGNAQLAAGDALGAYEAYQEAAASLEAAETAKVILSARLAAALDALLVDLRSNAAAAALVLRDWDGAIDAATAVLQAQPAHAKALYRRARGRAATGDIPQARADLEALLRAQPSNAAARKLLEELPCEPVLV